jgi:hypothetical protein
MKRWLSSFIAVAVGLSIGAGIGYAVALIRARTNSVLIARPAGSRFERIYIDMGKLNALETLASNCKGVSDITSVLVSEADLIQNLGEAGNGSELAPAINVARSRLAIRNALSAELAKDSKVQSEQEARAQKLLEGAGWQDASAARMKQIIAALDQEQCQQSSANGERTR